MLPKKTAQQILHCTKRAAILCAFFHCTPPCSAEMLSVPAIFADAVNNSFDTRLARAQANQHRADVKVALADYYPTFNLFFASEYDRGLKKISQTQPIISVGNTTLNTSTRFQDLLTFQGNWTLFDFGARHFNVLAARRMYDAALVGADAATRDMKLSIIDIYSQALSSYKTLKIKTESIPLYGELFQLRKRMYAAGSVSRLDLTEQSLKLVEAEDAVKDARAQLTQQLKELGKYTHRSYDIDNVELVDLDDSAPVPALPFRAESTPDYRMYDLQIASKRAEIRSLFAQRFPKMNLYSGYILYGTNKDTFDGAIGNFGNRLVNVGISVQWTIFDGFKNGGQRDRKRYEIEQLEIERDKKLWELQSEHAKAAATLAPLGAQLATKAEIINRGEEKIDMYSRVTKLAVQERSGLLNQKTQLLEQQLAAEKIRIQQAAARRKLQVLTGA